MSETGLLAERAEMDAWIDMVRAAPAPLAAGLGLEVRAIGDGTALVAPRMDAPEFNRVIGLGLTRPATEAEVEAAVAIYRPLGLKAASFQLGPMARPQAALQDWLSARGLQRRPLDWAKVARRAGAAVGPETELTVVEAGRAEAGAFSQTVCAGFGMPDVLRPWLEALVGRPDWRTYVAFDGEAPAAAAAMHLGEDWGWLGIAATHPGARRKGGQGALMARRIEDAAEAGKTWTFTETGAPTAENPNHPSYRNMMRLGFEELYRRANYAL